MLNYAFTLAHVLHAGAEALDLGDLFLRKLPCDVLRYTLVARLQRVLKYVQVTRA